MRAKRRKVDVADDTSHNEKLAYGGVEAAKCSGATTTVLHYPVELVEVLDEVQNLWNIQLKS